MASRTASFLVLIAAVAIGCSRGPLVLHEFSSSAEGWQVAGDTGPIAPVFHASGGRVAGYISNKDEAVGETWYYQAPATVLAQLPVAEGGRLEYTIKQDAPDAGFPDDD